MKTPNTFESKNGTITSGDNLSYWFSSAVKPIAFEKLNQDINTDILVIGGGISGLTTAYCLAKEGRKVILVEDGFIGSGETGRTTAHLTCALDDRYFELKKWTKKHFPAIKTIEFKWSGQVMEPLDSLAYIGKNPGEDNIYIITGDSGNGMTHGTLGGLIITDIITGRDNPWIKLYSPSRISLKTAGDYLQEVGNMILQYGDWLTKEDIKEVGDLKPGEGGIISSGLKKITLYRDEQNNLHTCTAVFPHLGGILQWNADEKTFDCPMHGSRFTNEGTVINGPATSDLKKSLLTKNLKFKS